MSEVAVDQSKLEQSLEGAYAPGQLPFCHDPSYKLRFSDRWLCSLSEADQQRCPAFKKLCATKPAPEPQPQRSSSSSSGPTPLGFVAEVLFWILIAGLVVALIAALRRMLVSRRETPEATPERPSLQPTQAPAPAPVSGDTDVSRLLDKARRAADRGELDIAIDAAHAAAVQGLSAAGRVEVDRDRTNGDYVRQLRGDPPLQKEFKAIVGKVEVTQFGGVAPTRGSFDQVLDQVLSLLRRLAVLSLLLLAASALLGCGQSSGGSQERAELGPGGLYTLRRVLSDQGAKVRMRVAPLGRLDDEDIGLVVVYDTALEDEQREHLLRWVRVGGAAAVVGRERELEGVAQLRARHESCGHVAERGPKLEAAPLKLAVLGESSLVLDVAPDSVVAHRVDAVCGGHPYVVTAYVEDGTITFIPESELVSNASLSVADNAQLVAELLSVPGSTIELVGPWTGDGSDSPIQSIKSAGLLPVVLQLLALVALLALRQGTSFGARRDVLRRVRRAFADHVRAVAANYARARAGRLVSANYGLLLIDQLRERLCPGQKPTLFQLAGAIARRVGRPETEIVELLVEAKSTFDEQREDDVVDHKIIRELEQLSLQAGGIS